MNNMYYNKIAFIFVLSICVNIFNVNCGCCCGKYNNRDKMISIIFNGKPLKKLEDANKPRNVVNNLYIDKTNFYDAGSDAFNNNYEIKIGEVVGKGNYIIAVVEVEITGVKKSYIVSYVNDYTAGHTNKGFFQDCKCIKRIKILKSNAVSDTRYMFYGCSSLEKLYINNLDTSNVINMSYMFCNCSSLKELDLSNFKTNNATYMIGMFSECTLLENLDLKNFNTSKVTEMSGMFSECSSLKELNLTSFNTDNVTDMNNMFSRCKSLTNLNLSSFNTKCVTNMISMFKGCESLEKLDLSNFNTKSVTSMGDMFYECKILNELNVLNFYVGDTTDTTCIFFDCPCLETDSINVNDENTRLKFIKALTLMKKFK